MCAIFGYSGYSDKDLIIKMSNNQKFRGPDEFNYFTDDKVTIGNNRLSIIDVDHGSQPISSEENRFVIVYNGMIYNFKEIREHLKKQNIKFNTDSDTEVFLKSYIFWKDECYNYFDGMWAACIYDKIENRLILSRDYLGQKPLYYYTEKNKFCFSSKSDSIFLTGKLEKKINKKSLGQFLLYSHIPAPLTIYENIHQVRPGEIIKYNLNTNQIEKKIYWDLAKGSDFNQFFKKENNFPDLFKKKINEFTTSDVGFGVLLSGGIDSYLITNEVAKKFKEQISTYTLGFK